MEIRQTKVSRHNCAQHVTESSNNNKKPTNSHELLQLNDIGLTQRLTRYRAVKQLPQNGICNPKYVSFLKFFHTGTYFPLLHKSAPNPKFSNKNNHLPAWRDFKIFFSRPLFTVIFNPKMVISRLKSLVHL